MDVSDIAEQYANGSRDRWPVGCAGRAITVQPQLYLGSRENFMGVKSADGNVAGEGHGLRDPQHAQDAVDRTLAWFDKYLN
jgi:hypothetical protein